MRNLYRRYRPLKLSDIIGQDQVTQPLQNSLKQGKINHAYLFVGPRGCGKTSVARILAHEVNSFTYNLEDDYVDIIEIDGASNRGIDDIRELREKVTIAPTTGKYKVYIIDEVHMLTKEAFNALLKTLEEPPAHAIFIMATTDAYKVPVTITSRAQTYTFKLADDKTMFDFLRTVVQKEKINITDDALKIVARRGGGSFRDSLSLLDQISTLSEKEITKDTVISAMGLPQDERVAELLAEYTSGDISKITKNLRGLLTSGVKAETLTEEIISYILNNPKPELIPLLAQLPEVKAPYAEAKLLVALTIQSATSQYASQPANNDHGNNPSQLPIFPEPKAKNNLDKSQAPLEPKVEDMPIPITTTQVTTEFSWDNFIQRVQELSDAVYSQLIKTQYEFDGEALQIYPMKRIVKSILSRDNNKRILVDAVGGKVKITIHDENETPNNVKKDQTLTRISDIMGGEVQSDGGGDPF